MSILETLASRNSSPLLKGPAPSESDIRRIYEAMMRAPDHARLRPCRIQVWHGDGLKRMGQVFADYLLRKDPAATEDMIDRAHSRPLRAPMVIAVIANVVEHAKVPAVEQLISAGCSAYIILLGLDALGYGGMWRTGDIAYDSQACHDLGLTENEHLVGFIYTGTPQDRTPKPVDIPAFEQRVSFISS